MSEFEAYVESMDGGGSHLGPLFEFASWLSQLETRKEGAPTSSVATQLAKVLTGTCGGGVRALFLIVVETHEPERAEDPKSFTRRTAQCRGDTNRAFSTSTTISGHGRQGQVPDKPDSAPSQNPNETDERQHPRESHTSYDWRTTTCKSEEASDCAIWSVWKILEARVSSENTGDHPGEPSTEFAIEEPLWIVQENCRTDLEHSAHGRSDVEKIYLRRALYCVAIGFRFLHPTELFDAVTTAIDNESPLSLSRSQSVRLRNSNDLMMLCDGILTRRSDGTVDFRRDYMRFFLLNSQLPEMRNKHQTMASICLEQIRRIASRIVLRPWHGFRKRLSNMSGFPFFRYVLMYWDSHYRLGETDSPELPGQLFHLIEAACLAELPVGEDYLEIYVRQHAIDIALQVCMLYGFDKLANICRQMGARCANGSRQSVSAALSKEEMRYCSRLLSALLLKHESGQMIIHPLLLDSRHEQVASTTPTRILRSQIENEPSNFVPFSPCPHHASAGSEHDSSFEGPDDSWVDIDYLEVPRAFGILIPDTETGGRRSNDLTERFQNLNFIERPFTIAQQPQEDPTVPSPCAPRAPRMERCAHASSEAQASRLYDSECVPTDMNLGEEWVML